jgi:hypothetical protein
MSDARLETPILASRTSRAPREIFAPHRLAESRYALLRGRLRFGSPPLALFAFAEEVFDGADDGVAVTDFADDDGVFAVEVLA